MRIAVVIATKGRPGPLAAALQSTAEALPSSGEVIVVDGDPDRSAEPVLAEACERYPGLAARYIASPAGSALQRNVGIDAASGEIVVFFDDDVTFQPGVFEALLDAYADPSVVGVTGYIDMPRRDRLANDPSSRMRWLLLGAGRQGTITSFGFRRPILDANKARDVEYMYGPLMSARRELAAEVRFDEALTNYALGEDDDFSFRLSRRGRIRYEPAARIYHHELGLSQIDRRRVNRLQVVNRAYLFRKNHPQTLRARAGFAALVAMLCAHRVLNREWSGLRGLLEGISHARRSDGRAPAATASQRRVVEAPPLASATAQAPRPISASSSAQASVSAAGQRSPESVTPAHHA